MKENNVIEWLKKYFKKQDINEYDLKQVLHFSLIWNLFEHTYFTYETQLKPELLLELGGISNEYLSDECINKCFDYFRRRYFQDELLHDRFNKLRLSTRTKGQNSNYEYCKTIFTTKNPLKCDQTKTIFLVIHRFRNNLFHGHKDPKTLNIYNKQFIVINNFLMHFIETTSDNKLINKERLKKIA